MKRAIIVASLICLFCTSCAGPSQGVQATVGFEGLIYPVNHVFGTRVSSDASVLKASNDFVVDTSRSLVDTGKPLKVNSALMEE